MTKLTPKGMRDFSPKEMYIRQEVIQKIREIFKLYGFRPLETPALEYVDTLKAKAGAEVEKQIFVIEGGEYGLRFDLTVPLARFASSFDEAKPFKRYAIDRVWRKEEPQRGRFREFYQADADIIGSNSMRAEAELLSLGVEVCRSFGFEKPRILINNRKIIDGILDKVGLEKGKNEKERSEVCRILDKTDKIGEIEVIKQIEELIGKPKASELAKVIVTKGSNKEKLEMVRSLSEEGVMELEQIIKMCDFDIEVDLALVRGLGYYTGTVYEVKLSEGMGTVLSGGRYDNLLGVYGQGAAAVGISVGIERLVTLLSERNDSEKSIAGKKTDTKVFICSIKPEVYEYSLEIARILRNAGVVCETDLNERKLGKQFEYVNSLGIPFTIVIGEKEKEEKKVTLRDMKKGSEEKMTKEQLLKFFEKGT